MSSNGQKRDRKRRSSSEAQRAAAVRISRQVAVDRERRVAPSISLPKLSCLEQPPDGETPERAA